MSWGDGLGVSVFLLHTCELQFGSPEPREISGGRGSPDLQPPTPEVLTGNLWNKLAKGDQLDGQTLDLI